MTVKQEEELYSINLSLSFGTRLQPSLFLFLGHDYTSLLQQRRMLLLKPPFIYLKEPKSLQHLKRA